MGLGTVYGSELGLGLFFRVQVPNGHIVSLILSYLTTILSPST